MVVLWQRTNQISLASPLLADLPFGDLHEPEAGRNEIEARMLTDDGLAESRLRSRSVCSYMDNVPKNDRDAYVNFLASLVSRGLIRVCRSAISRVTRFFVSK